MSAYVIKGANILGEKVADIAIKNGMVTEIGSDLNADGAT